MASKTDRRCFLARGIAGAAGVGAALTSIEENILRAAVDEGTAKPAGEATPQTDTAPASFPTGKIGNVSMSRLLIGGNLMGGWAHSRDLMYASQLFREYNTEAKIFQTLDLCQALGVNTLQMDPKCWEPIEKYNKARSTPIQTMVCIPFMEDKTAMNATIKEQIDKGATLLYSHGGVTDSHMMNGGNMDVIAQMVDLIKAQGVPAGVGGHSLNMPIQCEKQKVNNDFYVKTFHIDRYWSATPAESRKEYDWMARADEHNANNDSMWCNNPEETAAFMETVQKPWVAFKVMAAGAISPHIAIPYAYKNGADFVIAGMFDFQVEPDVKIALGALPKAQDRKRKWYS